MSIEHDAFFSFYRPQVALPIKTGGEVLGVPMSIGKHRRGRPGKAGVDYQGHTGRRVQRRGVNRLLTWIGVRIGDWQLSWTCQL